MNQVGDGPEGQPTEGVASLESLASLMDDSGEGEAALDGSEDSEASDESEGGESLDADSDTDGEDASDEGDDAQEEATFTIKHDGKDVTLKQSELVEMAQKGFDYSQKTMAVAEERKAVAAERATAEQYRQHQEQIVGEQLSRLQALEQFYASELGEPPPVAWAQQDAAYYLAQKELYENRKGQLEQARTAIVKLQDDQQRQRQAWFNQQADATEKALRDTLPGWNDDTLPALAKYAEAMGLTPDKVDVAFLQEGFWKALHKAKAYDDLLAKKAQMKPIAPAPAKVVKPGTSNPQPPHLARRQEAMKRHNAAPSLNSLAELL